MALDLTPEIKSVIVTVGFLVLRVRPNLLVAAMALSDDEGEEKEDKNDDGE